MSVRDDGRAQTKARGFRDGIDVEHLNRLNDELEIADFLRELAADTKRQSEGNY